MTKRQKAKPQRKTKRKTPKKRGRSAVSGKFESVATAKADAAHSVVETVKPRKKR